MFIGIKDQLSVSFVPVACTHSTIVKRFEAFGGPFPLLKEMPELSLQLAGLH